LFTRGYEVSDGDARCPVITEDPRGVGEVEILLCAFALTTGDGRSVAEVAILLGLTGFGAAAASPKAHALTVSSGTVAAAIIFIALLMAGNG
jgi:hypothetical protein